MRLHLGADRAGVRAPLQHQVELDADAPLVAGDLHALADEVANAGHLARRVGRVGREDVGRDQGLALHYSDLRTSSVTSGLAKNRNGTRVVPSPGETCSVTPPSR